jgi:hypothetical protein
VKRLDRAIDTMDENAADADGRWRLSTPAKSDYAFWDVLLRGWVGWVVGLGCAAALAALLVWLYG